MGSVSSIVFVFDIQKNPQNANIGSTLRPDEEKLQNRYYCGKACRISVARTARRLAFVVLASPQIVKRITANRSPQSGQQPAKFFADSSRVLNAPAEY
jgi:hypothetical protein